MLADLPKEELSFLLLEIPSPAFSTIAQRCRAHKKLCVPTWLSFYPLSLSLFSKCQTQSDEGLTLGTFLVLSHSVYYTSGRSLPSRIQP